MPWLYTPEAKEVEEVTAPARGDGPVAKRSPVKIHAPPNAMAMREPPLGQVSSLTSTLRPSSFISEELFIDPNGALVRTSIASPDKDWGRRMPHRPWCTASEPPYQFNSSYGARRSFGSPVKASKVQDGSYYASTMLRPGSKRSVSAPAAVRDPYVHPEGYAVTSEFVPVPASRETRVPLRDRGTAKLATTNNNMEVTQRVSAIEGAGGGGVAGGGCNLLGSTIHEGNVASTGTGWQCRKRPVAYDHDHLRLLPSRALHHLWAGHHAAQDWRSRYVPESRDWAWRTSSNCRSFSATMPQGRAWACPWLS